MVRWAERIDHAIRHIPTYYCGFNFSLNHLTLIFHKSNEFVLRAYHDTAHTHTHNTRPCLGMYCVFHFTNQYSYLRSKHTWCGELNFPSHGKIVDQNNFPSAQALCYVSNSAAMCAVCVQACHNVVMWYIQMPLCKITSGTLINLSKTFRQKTKLSMKSDTYYLLRLNEPVHTVRTLTHTPCTDRKLVRCIVAASSSDFNVARINRCQWWVGG